MARPRPPRPPRLMPIFEYRCRQCANAFERLVLGSGSPACPLCGAADPEKLLSSPRVKSSATRSMSARAVKRRDAKQARDRMHERIRCERSHDRHG